MKKLLGIFLATLALFIWGFIYWGVLDAWQYGVPTGSPELLKSLTAGLGTSATYYFPVTAEGESGALIHYIAPGTLNMMGEMGMGFLVELITISVLVWLISYLLPLARPAEHLLFIFVAGTTFSFFSHFTANVFLGNSMGWTLVNFVYEASAWLLAGLVLSFFLKLPQARY